MFTDNTIIITNNIHKKDILKKISSELLNIKIYTLQEFNKLYFYDYNTETILYVMKKYNVINEIAKIYLDNLFYIEDKIYSSDKLNFLSSLKKDLIEHKQLKENKQFQEYIQNKNITLYQLSDSKEINKLKELLEEKNTVEVILNKELKYTSHKVYECNTLEEEVLFVANQICNQIKNGIDIKNIYLTNLNEEYYKTIRRIFPMFHIPVTLKDNGSIYGTYLVNKFLELYKDDMVSTLEELYTYVETPETEEIYNQILDIVNNYAFIDNYEEVLPLIQTDLKNTKKKTKDIINSVHEIPINEMIEDHEYLYLLSFNQGILPTIHKDESYLTDYDKKELNISLTVDNNNQEKENFITYVSNIKNITITYKKNANGEEYNISNINEQLKYPVEQIHNSITSYSNLYNQITLTSLKDEFNKYGTKNDTLYSLSSHYKNLPYNTYNHVFTNIDKEDLHKFLNNKLYLSYTKVDNYYKCPFSYYLNYILNLNIYEDTFYQKIGTLFHAILEKYNTYTKSYEDLWKEELNNLNTTFTNQELFFLEKLHDELLFIIDTIKEQENYTDLHDEYHEEKVYTSLSGEMQITFSGIIDKIKYRKENNRTIIAIIDYKTGSVDIDLTTTPYGIGMQLPVYLYLAENSNKLENIEVAGFYLQHILNNEISVEPNKTYEEQKKKELLLQGYSSDNFEILSSFDHSFDKSNMIKSMSLTKDNKFGHYAKVLSKEQMNIIKNIAKKNIEKSANKISNGEFPISPKKIGDINYGCRFCKFKDICFHTNDDINELKELTLEDIFGGEE